MDLGCNLPILTERVTRDTSTGKPECFHCAVLRAGHDRFLDHRVFTPPFRSLKAMNISNVAKTLLAR